MLETVWLDTDGTVHRSLSEPTELEFFMPPSMSNSLEKLERQLEESDDFQGAWRLSSPVDHLDGRPLTDLCDEASDQRGRFMSEYMKWEGLQKVAH
ncbi:MAG: hypothetical protein AAFQ77_03080 [Myxococcota bacterium]